MEIVIGLIIAGLFLVSRAVRIIPEYERGVVFRLGRVMAAKGPGVIFLVPILDRLVKVDLRTIVMDVEKQDVITRDNVTVAVNAVVYFRVIDPVKAIISVENFHYATGQLAQTTLRSVAGQQELDDLLAERQKINTEIQQILDQHTDPWGVKVTQVEVKHIDMPQDMQRAMARQAEAERERRAKVIAAEGEHQASQTLADAARIMETSPMSLQLRYLQTLTEVAVEHNSTIVFPVPIDLFSPFMRGVNATTGSAEHGRGPENAASKTDTED